MAASNATVPLGNRVSTVLKREFDETAEELGMTSTAALTVLMKRFVEDGGFPFEVRRRVPTKAEFTAEMEARYERMLAGEETEHELLEV